MKGLDRAFLIGAILLIIGFVWAFMMKGMGTLEWILLLAGMILGLLAGLFQGWTIARKNRGQIGPGRMKLYIVAVIVVFIALKVYINISIPSYLATSESGIYLSVVFAVSGLLLGRYSYSRLPVNGTQKLS